MQFLLLSEHSQYIQVQSTKEEVLYFHTILIFVTLFQFNQMLFEFRRKRFKRKRSYFCLCVNSRTDAHLPFAIIHWWGFSLIITSWAKFSSRSPLTQVLNQANERLFIQKFNKLSSPLSHFFPGDIWKFSTVQNRICQHNRETAADAPCENNEFSFNIFTKETSPDTEMLIHVTLSLFWVISCRMNDYL